MAATSTRFAVVLTVTAALALAVAPAAGARSSLAAKALREAAAEPPGEGDTDIGKGTMRKVDHNDDGSTNVWLFDID